MKEALTEACLGKSSEIHSETRLGTRWETQIDHLLFEQGLERLRVLKNARMLEMKLAQQMGPTQSLFAERH